MACKLEEVFDDPLCRFRGDTGDKVTLTLVATAGSALFHDAFYAGTSLISAPSAEITFTLKSGSNDLSVLYTLSPNSTAELHEKCDGNTLLDDAISPLNNAKIYHICGTGAAVTKNAAAKKTSAKKSSAKKTAAKKKRGGL